MACFNTKGKRVLVIWLHESSESFWAEVQIEGKLQKVVGEMDVVNMRVAPGNNFWVEKYRDAVAEDRFLSAPSLEY